MNSLMQKYSNNTEPQKKKNDDSYGYTSFAEEDPNKTKIVYGNTIYNKTDKVNSLIQRYSDKKTYNDFLPAKPSFDTMAQAKKPVSNIFSDIFINDSKDKPQLNSNQLTDEELYKQKAGWSDKLFENTIGKVLPKSWMDSLRADVIKNMRTRMQQEEEAKNKNINDFAPLEQNSPFIHNIMEQGRSAFTAGAYIPDKSNIETGNKVLDFASNLVGQGLGMASGGASSVNNALSPFGNKAENLAIKGLNTPNIVNKLAPAALKSGSEFATLNALDTTMNGGSLQDTGKSALQGFGMGAAFGGGSKAIGEGIKAVKNINPYLDNLKVNAIDSKFNNLEPSLKPLNPSLEPLKPKSNINTPLDIKSPLDTNINPSIGATDRTRSISQIVSSDADKSKLKPKDLFDKVYTRFIDTNSPIKKVDEGTYIKATNSKNVGGTVDYILQNGLVDRQGNKIGESLKNIVKDIPKNEEDSFMNYVLQRHNIDRAREEFKQVPKVDKQGFLVKDKLGNQVYDKVITKNSTPVYADFTPEQSMKAVSIIEKQHPEYKQLNDRLVKFLNDFNGEWGNKSGLISDDLWKELQSTYKNYVPTQRSFTELEQGVSKTNGRGFVDQSTPLSKATGSDRDIINPVENIMSLVNRTVRTARYNEVGQDLVKAIEKNPEGLRQFAEIIPDGTQINPNVNNIVSVLVNGKPVNVQVNNKPLLESLQSIHKTNVGDIEKATKTATNMFKQLITQKNPVFAVRNIARDLPTAYINGSEANPLKFTRDLFAAGKDLATNSEIAQQYKALGGGGSNFFNSNNTAKSARELTKTSIPQKIGNAIETFNNITESAPRLAEFKRTANKTGDLQKALYEAGDVTTNFSRGGDITKHLDSFVPYLNAGIQGLDKLARQFVNKPIPTVAKGLIGITSLTAALDHVNKDNPNYQQLDNRTKDNYFLFPKEDGTFIKIPKSRELGVLFGSLFERTIRANRGDQEAFKGYGNTVTTNFSPANPLENNIFSPALALNSNKDFANRDIIPRAMLEDNRSKYLQYDEKTSEITKKIAQEANKLGVDLSPKQMDYLIRSYTGVIGQLGLPATTKNTMQGPTAEKLLKPITTQFVADPKYSNQTLTNFYDNYDKIKTMAADRNILEQIPSKVQTPEEKLKSAFTKASKDISDINKALRKAETENNNDKIDELRRRLIEVATKANQIYYSNRK